MKDLMQDLSSKHIIPYMEMKIRVLNQQVLYFQHAVQFILMFKFPIDNWSDLFFFTVLSSSIVIRFLRQGKVLGTKLKTYGGGKEKTML